MAEEWVLTDGTWLRRTGPAGSPPTASWTPNGIPPLGQMLTGIAVTGRSQTYLTDSETAAGATAGLWHAYYTGSGSQDEAVYAVSDVNWCHGRGLIPYMTFKPGSATGGSGSTGASWADMATGSADTWAETLAADLGATDGPVWVNIHHEPENDTGADATAYRAMQDRLLPFFKAYSNICTTINVMGYWQAYGGDGWDMWFPNDPSLVDVYCWDSYNLYGRLGSTSWNELTYYFESFQTWKASKGSGYEHLRCGLGETGWTDIAAALSSPPSGADGPANEWLNRLTDRMLSDYDAAALTYFNIDGSQIGQEPTATWRCKDANKLPGLAYMLNAGAIYPSF